MESPAPPAATTPRAEPDSMVELYERLRRLARRQRRQVGAATTLNTTALVHEVWLELDRERAAPVAPRDFFAYAAQAMRNLLIDHARRRLRPKHGGDAARVELDDDEAMPTPALAPEQLLDLDAALTRLEAEDPRAARVVVLHYFAGIGFEQIAEMLDLSSRTVKRDWRFARAWLHQQLDPPA